MFKNVWSNIILHVFIQILNMHPLYTFFIPDSMILHENDFVMRDFVMLCTLISSSFLAFWRPKANAMR